MQALGQRGLFDDPAVNDVIMGGGSFDFGDSILTQSLDRCVRREDGRSGLDQRERTFSVSTMRKIVTPMKLGAFERLYNRELESAVEKTWRARNLTYVQRRTIAQSARRHLDNVMGQIARDNLHTTNKFKDILGNIIAYPGWNIGTIRLFGGIGRGAYQLATGQALDMQARLALQYASG